MLQVTGNNETTIRCLTCPVWHQPDVTKSTCIPCLTMCHCPIEYVDVKGTCVRKNDIIPDSPTLYTLNFQGKYYSSSYMKTWVQPVASKCKVSCGTYRNKFKISLFSLLHIFKILIFLNYRLQVVENHANSLRTSVL